MYKCMCVSVCVCVCVHTQTCMCVHVCMKVANASVNGKTLLKLYDDFTDY